jgi:sucrose phosphorylase
VRGILPESEIEDLARRIEAGGGFVSKKANANGSQSPYELNVNYFDALSDTEFKEDVSRHVDRFITAHAILLAFLGVPAIYFHSLLGSRGWSEGVTRTGQKRSINREKLQRANVEQELGEAGSLRGQVFRRLSHLLKIRARNACFSPDTPQRVIQGPSSVFTLVREDALARKAILCVHNVGRQDERIELDLGSTSLASSTELHDLITGRHVQTGTVLSLTLAPYQSIWLTN